MAKRKETKGQTIQMSIVLFVLLSPFSWPLYCLSFFLFSLEHCIVCLFFSFLMNGHEKREKRTDNAMVMRKETKGQTIQWSGEKRQKVRVLSVLFSLFS
jgi:hypothetical protein